jgi:hypothetical protein
VLSVNAMEARKRLLQLYGDKVTIALTRNRSNDSPCADSNTEPFTKTAANLRKTGWFA